MMRLSWFMKVDINPITIILIRDTENIDTEKAM